MERVLMSWSGGKDGAMALAAVLEGGRHEVAALVTTVTGEYDRVSMHGVRRSLLERQAGSLGLPLEAVVLPKDASNEAYEEAMAGVLASHRERGVGAVVFGDIFLEDLRRYRESRLEQAGMRALFPLWKQETGGLARRFIASGFRAIAACVDTTALDARFAGREIDERFLAELPAGVDPCGENGEFHSFVYDGPLFERGIAVVTGERVLRDGRFCYCDLLEAQRPAGAPGGGPGHVRA